MADVDNGAGAGDAPAGGAAGAGAAGGDQGGGAAPGGAGASGFQGMGERMRAGGESIAQSGQQLGLKMLDQAETNTREAFRAMRAAAQAKDVSDVMRIQSEFLREAGGRSLAQAREIGELIASFGRETMGQFGGRR